MLTAPGTCLEIDIELHEQKKSTCVPLAVLNLEKLNKKESGVGRVGQSK